MSLTGASCGLLAKVSNINGPNRNEIRTARETSVETIAFNRMKTGDTRRSGTVRGSFSDRLVNLCTLAGFDGISFVGKDLKSFRGSYMQSLWTRRDSAIDGQAITGKNCLGDRYALRPIVSLAQSSDTANTTSRGLRLAST